MREVGCDLMEVWPKRCKVFVLWLGEEQVEFGAVELEAVDLAVLKFECANDRVGRVKSAGGGSESIVRAERSIGLKPVLKGAGGDLDVRSFSHDPLAVGQGIAEIECGDCVEDYFERVCSVFVGTVSEAVETLWAFIKLVSAGGSCAFLFFWCSCTRTWDTAGLVVAAVWLTCSEACSGTADGRMFSGEDCCWFCVTGFGRGCQRNAPDSARA